MNDDKIVYWLGNGRGNKYHLYKDCYYMGNCRPDARSGSVAEAKAAGRAEACKVCEERAARQVERGEDKPVNRVYWRYVSDETVWHLYDTCPDLDGAAKEGMLCSGTVEAAINTGRSMVCPLCKKRYGECHTQADMQEGKAEPVKAPAAVPGKKESTAKDLLAAVAVLVLLCGFVWWQNNPPHTSSRSTKTAAAVSEYSEAASTKATPRPMARPTATPKPTAVPVNEDSYTVYITRTGSKYHRSGCSYLKSKIAIEKKDAIAAGYTACSRCNP